MTMTKAEVREWALGNGFVESDDGLRLAAPWGKLSVEMEFGRRDVRVSITDGTVTDRVITFNPGNPAIHVGELGVLEGAGLSQSFVRRFRLDEREDVPPPPWMNEDYMEAVRRPFMRP